MSHLKHDVEMAATKAIKTAFIGGFAAVEDALGSLWGRGIDFEVLTEPEAKWHQVYQAVRKEVFDRGNRQLRMFLQELDLIFEETDSGNDHQEQD